ncbi:MAG: two-component regulator propeller domain-containing protein [Bacteroidales bacterium]
MRAIRVLILVFVLMALSFPARNYDPERMGPLSRGPFRVKAVYVDSYGVKWFGTSRGLYRYDNLTWSYYTENDHLAGNRVNALTFEESAYGPELWVATGKGVSVTAFDIDGITGSTSYTVEDGVLDTAVSDVAVDSYHHKYFGSESGITWFRDGTMEYLTYDMYVQSMVDAPVNVLCLFNDTLYVGADGGIGRFVSGVDGITGASRWTSEYGISPLSGNIKSILVDSRGHQWFGTDQGVQEHVGHQAKENWFLYTTEDGLVDNYVISILEDGQGGMWFGTRGGVSYLHSGEWTSYTTTDGLVSDTVYDMALDADGSVWFATHRGICRLTGSEFSDIYLDVPEKVFPDRTLKAWYHPGEDAIHLVYHLKRPGTVTARLYSVNGTLAGRWDRLDSGPGRHHVTLPCRSGQARVNRNGIYILLFGDGETNISKKIVILK